MQQQLNKIQINQLLIALKLIQMHTRRLCLMSDSQSLLDRLIHNYTKALPQ